MPGRPTGSPNLWHAREVRDYLPAGTGRRVVGLRGSGGPLREVALSLAPGATGLYGLNGAGKSTVLNIARRAAAGLRKVGGWDHLVVMVDPGSSLQRRIVKATVSRLQSNPLRAPSLPSHDSAWSQWATPEDLQQVLLDAVDDSW